MRRNLIAFLALSLFATSAFATSTIDPTIPKSPYPSTGACQTGYIYKNGFCQWSLDPTPIRNNFAAAANDINALQTSTLKTNSTITLTGNCTGTGTAANIVTTCSLPNAGTVTSINASGGTTGLNFSGGPITSNGTLTLQGLLGLANGGTGASTAAGARTALGLGTAATQNSTAFLQGSNNLSDLASAATSRTNLGATTVGDGLFTSLNAASARSILALGSLATANSVGLDAAETTGILPVAKGGTGTATPSLVAGTNVTITGTFPNQTINASGGGGAGTVNAGTTGQIAFYAANGTAVSGQNIVPVSAGGTGTAYNNNRSWRLSSIGDSNSARSAYHPPNIDYNLIKAPLWTASTAGWGVGMIMRNSNNTLYYVSAITTGTTGTTEPTAVTGGGIVDGGVTWLPYLAYSGKDAGSFQAWAERYSNGSLIFDLTAGFQAPEFSTHKCFVVNGGTNYTAPTITFTPSGTRATLTTSGGVITGVNITNSGRNATGTLSWVINDSTGSGAILSCSHTNSGTFAVSGSTTRDMLQLVPDACASRADIFTVLGGSNDITLNVTSYATLASAVSATTANLRAIYEGLAQCNKKIIPITIAPRTGQNEGFRLAARNQINDWIVAFARKEPWANPNGVEVSLADARAWTTDNSTLGDPQAGFLASDGLHYATRMGQVVGYFVAKAAERWTGPAMFTNSRSEGFGHGYNLTYNPMGNMFEGLVWSGSTTFNNVGDYVSNDSNKVYRLTGTVPCTTAASGGPTGTGASIADGTCTWAYVRQGGLSSLAAGVGGTNTAAAGIVFTGTPPAGTTLARQNGTASGTIVHTLESPRSDGRAGQRHRIAFSLGGGGTTEQWRLLLGNPTTTVAGIPAANIENKFYVLEVELEMSGYANMYPPYIQLFGQSSIFQNYDGMGLYSGGPFLAAGFEMLPATHDLAWPAKQKMVLRTVPMQLPFGTTSLNTAIYFNFNASGAADSATGTITINRIELEQVRP